MKTKLLRLISLTVALLMLATFAFAACEIIPDTPVDSDSESESDAVQPSDSESTPDSDTDTDGETEDSGTASPEYDVITIAKALELCGESGNITTERYYIRGTVVTVTSSQYGAMVVEDATGSIPVYGTYSADGEKTFTELEYQPVKGDEVLLHCILQNYNGTKEVKNARLIEYKNNQGNIDVSSYTPATIQEARDAQKGANLRVSGVVARITFANGMKPNGFILVSGGKSIYVYDGDAAQRVAIGNKVEIAGTKDYWILDTEISSAQKFNYTGCNQLTDVILISNDGKTDNSLELDKFETSTIKDILETPVSTDITTKVFKVNALVSKVPGNGFTNYYFNDIDGATGSYTYTQCNGNDFSWLDEYDGKICTVYLTALNAKSTSSACVFRFLPIAVYDEGFTFNTENTADFVLKYHAVDQFLNTYSGNPELELISSVSSELLGFANATISYTSSNTASVVFNNKNGKTVMECLERGVAQITVTVTHNGKTASQVIEITVSKPIDVNYINVNDAISADLNSEVTVHGIVGPSLVNRPGFYLIDDTGVIAIIVRDAEVFNGLAIGHEVVISGKRDRFYDASKGGTHVGQTCVSDATVLVNNYGKHEYNTSNFVTGKTLEDFHNLQVEQDYSTTVFILKATVVIEETPYYSSIKLSSGNTTVSLYSSSASQYGFLKQFAGQEITVELAACNWNNKNYYAGCALAVITENGKILNTLNFNN